ncbi:Uroporphyrinogen-III synthase [Frankliniella fusca]|uniref:Uroporphyrinogen-III synthase n=1 Tax=Frankliniella fusca TaxID=407009 RepID=A0AAE1LT82_9NEOP|nr:Uroporphyrinogen-III synthase [Frankliniella fusca]
MSFLDDVADSEIQEGNLEDQENDISETETEFDKESGNECDTDLTDFDQTLPNQLNAVDFSIEQHMQEQENRYENNKLLRNLTMSRIYSKSTLQNSFMTQGSVRKPLGTIQPVAKSSPTVQERAGKDSSIPPVKKAKRKYASQVSRKLRLDSISECENDEDDPDSEGPTINKEDKIITFETEGARIKN